MAEELLAVPVHAGLKTEAERFAGARETYAIEAAAGSGTCVLNGGAARLGEVGDELIILTTVLVPEEEVRLPLVFM